MQCKHIADDSTRTHWKAQRSDWAREWYLLGTRLCKNTTVSWDRRPRTVFWINRKKRKKGVNLAHERASRNESQLEIWLFWDLCMSQICKFCWLFWCLNHVSFSFLKWMWRVFEGCMCGGDHFEKISFRIFTAPWAFLLFFVVVLIVSNRFKCTNFFTNFGTGTYQTLEIKRLEILTVNF